MNKLLASAGTKEELTKLINEYFYSNNYIITDDNKVYHTKFNTTIDNVEVSFYRGRWKFKYVY